MLWEGNTTMEPTVIEVAQAPSSARLSLYRDITLMFYLLYVFCAGLSAMLGDAPDALVSPSANASSASNQFVLLGLFMIALTIARASELTSKAIFKGTAPYLAVLLIVAASPLWSKVPDVAIRRVLRFLLEFSALNLLASCYRDPRELLGVVWRTITIVVGLDIILLVMPELSYTDIGYQGIHGHKNQAGSFALLALPVALAAWARPGIAPSRIAALVVFAAVLFIVVVSQSKTSAVLALVSLVLAGLVLALSRLSGGVLVVTMLLAVGLGLVASYLISNSSVRLDTLLSALSIDPTLTGRDEVWRFTRMHASDRPWLGLGYGSFWNAGPTNEDNLRDFGITFAFGQAHNGYLDVLVQVGAIGMGCVFVMAAGILARLFSLARAGCDAVVAAVGLTIFSTFWLHNITESTLLRPGTDMWVLFVLLTLLIVKVSPSTFLNLATKGPRPNEPIRRRLS